MGSCVRLFVGALVLGAQACVTGHLLDAARRIERPVAYREAALTGDRLLVRYTAVVTNDIGEPLTRRERAAAIALADLRRRAPVEDFPVVRLADGAPFDGRRIVVLDGNRPGASTPFLEAEPDRVVLHADGDGAYPALYAGALARSHSAAWAYPLLPFTVAIDAVADPVLLFFAPMVITLGD